MALNRIELYNEEWREIHDYPNYEVSNFGRVRSKEREVTQFGHKKNYTRIKKGKVLQQRKQNAGYLVVWLSVEGKKKAITVHRLVATAFVKGNGNDVNHIDGNKINNRVDNLEWVTHSNNIEHAYCVLHRIKHLSKRVICIETGEVFQSMRDAAQAKGINAISIGHVINGRNKTAGGYTWKRE